VTNELIWAVATAVTDRQIKKERWNMVVFPRHASGQDSQDAADFMVPLSPDAVGNVPLNTNVPVRRFHFFNCPTINYLQK